MMNFDNLPDGWAIANLENFTTIIMGQSPPSSTYNEDGQGLPFFQGKSEFGPLYPTTKKWCTKPQKIAEKGDILISVRAPVGPTNICHETSCIGRGLAAIRGLEKIESLFIIYLLRTFQNYIAVQGHGTTFDGISAVQLKKLKFPIPPLAEQEEIVKKVEKIFEFADIVEQKVTESLKNLERLNRKILGKAFRGELVPQDPNDEPASILLERIKAQKTEKPPKKRRKS